jgi:hypothetical protein
MALYQLFTLTRPVHEAAISTYRPGGHLADFAGARLMRMEDFYQESVKFLEWTYA